MLKAGWRNSLTWSRNGEPSGSISYESYPTCLRLRYRLRGDGEDWEDVEQRVSLVHAPLHCGGERCWFLCPRCARRCRVLYAGRYFYCRLCYGLKYQSQSEASWERPISRCQKIRERLGGTGGIDDPFPEKPKACTGEPTTGWRPSTNAVSCFGKGSCAASSPSCEGRRY